MVLRADISAEELAPNSSREAPPAKPRFSDRTIAVAVFLGCLAYLCLFLRYSALELDEGIVLQGAERVLRGELPYRDFFTFYTPGSFYLVALVFRVFGDSFIVARFSLAVAGAICSVVTYALARRVCSRGVAVFCALLATTTGAAFRFLVLHNPYSTLFACISLYCAIRYLDARRNAWLFGAGSLASITLLTEQSKGAGLLAGLALGLALLWRFDRQAPRNSHAIFGLVLGASWPLLATCAYFGSHHAVGVMLQDWLWPLHHYTRANHVPYGFQNWSDETENLIFRSGPLWLRTVKVLTVSPNLFVPVLPLISVALLGWLVGSACFKRARPENFGYYLLICSVCAGLLASIVVVRPDSLHFMYLTPVWYVVLAWVLGSRSIPGRLMQRARPYFAAYVVTAFGMLAFASLLSAKGATHSIATRRALIKTPKEDTVIPYVQSHVPEGGQMLVYPYLPLYNYLTATRSPSRYDFFQPGMNTSEQAQEIIDSLKSESSVLLQPGFNDTIPFSWANTPLQAIANDPVTDYIVRNYHVCGILTSPEVSRFWWMVPKNVACP